MRQYIYRITRVTGCMRRKLKVGALIVARERDPTGYTWHIMNMKKGKLSGTFSGDFLGPYNPALMEALRQGRSKQRRLARAEAPPP
jgi:hypothetical protein